MGCAIRYGHVVGDVDNNGKGVSIEVAVVYALSLVLFACIAQVIRNVG